MQKIAILLLAFLLASCSMFRASKKNNAIKAIKTAYNYKNFDAPITFKWAGRHYYLNQNKNNLSTVINYPKKAYISFKSDSTKTIIDAGFMHEQDILLALLIADAEYNKQLSSLGNIFYHEANAMAIFIENPIDSLYTNWQYLKAFRQRYISDIEIVEFLKNGSFYAGYLKNKGKLKVTLNNLLATNNFKQNLLAMGILTANFPQYINNLWLPDYISLNQIALNPKKLKKILKQKNIKLPLIFDEKYSKKLQQLNAELIKKGVDKNWLWQNLNNPEFKFYKNISKYYKKMSEHKVKRKEKTIKWYMDYHGVDKKVKKADKFIKKYKATLDKIPKKFGFDYEIVVAILGMETNFAKKRYRGKFGVFSTLVSHYLLVEKRQKFAVRNLAALYEFSNKTKKDVYYYIGSFAGACGYGQFIPSSLNAFFIDEDFVDENIDVFSVEDNIMSIANYLHQHGLNEKTKNDENKNYKAVYSYNHSKAYAKSVLYIKNKLKEKRK